jgi:hypothetical protein
MVGPIIEWNVKISPHPCELAWLCEILEVSINLKCTMTWILNTQKDSKPNKELPFAQQPINPRDYEL